MGNPNIIEAGKATRFSKSNPPKKPGRKPSILKKWVKDFDLSKSDVNAMFKNFLFAKTTEEFEELLKNEKELKKLPAAIGLQLNILKNAARNGNGKYFEFIFNMLFGKPVQQLNISEQRNDIPDDPEERRQLIEQIENELALTKTTKEEV